MLTSLAYSQEKGSLFLNVFPKDAIIRMNDTLLKSQETYLLDTGNYSLKIWLPTREYVERTVNVQENKTTQLLEVLSYSDDYKKYKRKMTMYHIDKTLMRYVSPIILAVFIQNSLSTWKDLDEEVTTRYDLAITAKNNYDNGVFQDDLLVQKSSYEMRKAAYEDKLNEYNDSRRNRMIIGGALIVTTAALEYLSFKLKKPEYQEKVLLSSFSVGSYNNQLVPSYSLTYKF